MRIVQIINSLTIGGIEKIVTDISNNIDKKKHKVYIITLSNSDFSQKKNVDNNIEIISLPYDLKKRFELVKFWLFGIPKMIRILNKINPDIVHTHVYYHYLLFLSLTIKFSKIKPFFFRTVHTSGLFYKSDTLINKLRRAVEIISLKIYPTRNISISKSVFDNIEHLYGKYIVENRYIPNGIDQKRFLNFKTKNINKEEFGLSRDIALITYVARLDIGKNHLCLVNAFEILTKELPQTHLFLAGDGPLRIELENIVKKKNLSRKITFLGEIENVASILKITDIGIFPSQFEGFGISLLEKMLVEVPVITSDIDVFKELIIDNENGLICDVNNSNDYAQKMKILLNNPDIKQKIAKQGKLTAYKFDINNVVKQTISFYEDSINL